MIQASILASCFRRAALLDLHLQSIDFQTARDRVEVIVLNDGTKDETEKVCKKFSHLNVKYVFTGQRNQSDNILWRVPGFCLNIGAKLATGKVLILACAEMFHVENNTLESMINAVNEDDKRLTITTGLDDNGRILDLCRRVGVRNAQRRIIMGHRFGNIKALNTQLPFYMAMSKQRFIDIGGYDEDFTGEAFDDDDIVTRLQNSGCYYHSIPQRVIHLFHPRKQSLPNWHFNKALFEERKGQVVRNVGREWGVLKSHSSDVQYPLGASPVVPQPHGDTQ